MAIESSGLRDPCVLVPPAVFTVMISPGYELVAELQYHRRIRRFAHPHKCVVVGSRADGTNGIAPRALNS
jgi:hypothetical protein